MITTGLAWIKTYHSVRGRHLANSNGALYCPLSECNNLCLCYYKVRMISLLKFGQWRYYKHVAFFSFSKEISAILRQRQNLPVCFCVINVLGNSSILTFKFCFEYLLLFSTGRHSWKQKSKQIFKLDMSKSISCQGHKDDQNSDGSTTFLLTFRAVFKWKIYKSLSNKSIKCE